MSAERFGPGLLRLGAAAWWGYLWAVFLYRERVAGVALGAAPAFLLLALGLVAAFRIPGRPGWRRRVPPARMLELGLLAVSLLAMVLAADLALAVRDNVRRGRAAAAVDPRVRSRDPHVWHGELFPRQYYPTNGTFFLYKPLARVSAVTYGEYYSAGMLRSRTLADSVLEPRRLTYAIGPHGLRELEPMTGTGIYALGDSYAMGYGTDEGRTWTDLLGAALHEPVFNLGLSSTGPRPQLELLRYLLETHRDSMRVRELLWMIYEGNDLENSYAATRAEPAAPGASPLDGTLLDLALAIPGRIKAQSVARRLWRGELRLRPPGAASGGHLVMDGVPLAVPLYHSARWGYMLFSPADVEQAASDRDYLMGHPNRPLFDQALRDMASLGREHGFRVTVIVAPTAARLYGAAFEGFPPVAEPWFARYAAERAAAAGFGVIDLVTLMRPAADSALLYYRDDHHWNERGNAVAAELIGAFLAARR